MYILYCKFSNLEKKIVILNHRWLKDISLKDKFKSLEPSSLPGNIYDDYYNYYDYFQKLLLLFALTNLMPIIPGHKHLRNSFIGIESHSP